jgi:hypothetical protein
MTLDRRPVVRLPLGIAPVTGEHAGSFVHRLAITNGLTGSQLTAMWGTKADGVRVALTGHQATPGLLIRLRELTGGAVPNLDLLWAYPPAELLSAAPRWRPLGTSRYCPHCLADHGAWQHAWRSKLTVRCPAHACLLRERCPTCGAATLGHGRLNYPGPQAPVVCAACVMSLITDDPQVGSLDWPALEAIHGLDRQRPRAAGPDQIDSDMWTLSRAALRVMPELPVGTPECIAAPWEIMRASGGAQRGAAVSGELAVAAVALVLADEALHDGHALRRLYRDHAASLWQVKASAKSEQLARTAAAALNRRPRAGRHRVLGDVPCVFDAGQIPQRLPAELYQRFFADITPRDQRITRRVVPIILAGLATGRGWQRAAADLGLLPLANAATVSNWLDAARATDTLAVTFGRLRAVAEHYNSSAAVDYAARRRRCGRLERIDEGWWRQACEREGQRAGRNGVKNRCAAVFVWESATCGDPWRAPWLSGADAPLRRNAYRQFAVANLAALRPHLEELGRELVDLSERI